MKKKEFCKIQAEAFRDYASKFEIKHREDFLFLFVKWAESKYFSNLEINRIFDVLETSKDNKNT